MLTTPRATQVVASVQQHQGEHKAAVRPQVHRQVLDLGTGCRVRGRPKGKIPVLVAMSMQGMQSLGGLGSTVGEVQLVLMLPQLAVQVEVRLAVSKLL